jgi:hypothetical protein
MILARGFASSQALSSCSTTEAKRSELPRNGFFLRKTFTSRTPFATELVINLTGTVNAAPAAYAIIGSVRPGFVNKWMAFILLGVQMFKLDQAISDTRECGE